MEVMTLVIFVSGRECYMLQFSVTMVTTLTIHSSSLLQLGPHPLLVGNIRFMFMCS